jgi:dipeptidyl aminopeptidase/acylaminoacyl peptidase
MVNMVKKNEFKIIERSTDFPDIIGLEKRLSTYASSREYYNIRGNRERDEIIFNSLGDDGEFKLFIRESNGEERIISKKASFTHGITLHPSKTLVLYSKDKDGLQDESLVLLNYTSSVESVIAKNVGRLIRMKFVDDNIVIAVSSRKKNYAVLRINTDSGEIKELYTTTSQVVGVDFDRDYVVFSEGRGITEIVVINALTGELLKRISENEACTNQFPRISPSGEKFCYSSDRGGSEEIIIRSFKDYAIIQNCKIPGNSVGYFILDLNYIDWIDDNNLVVINARNAKSTPYQLHINGEWSTPLSQGVVKSDVLVTRNGVYWPAKYGYENVLEKMNDVQDCEIVDMEDIWFESFDGMRIQGWLTRVKNIVNSDNNSLIIYAHGGPTMVDMAFPDPMISEMVQAGYHVFQINYRGSTTFGKEYQDRLVGDMGGGEIKDIIYGTKHIMNLLSITKKPVMVGGSYGGYITLMALGLYPEIWSGGIAIVPVADLIGQWEEADAHYKQFLTFFLGGTFEEKPTYYEERSPITHSSNLNCSVLIIAGKNDPNAYYKPTKRYYDKAISEGKEIYLFSMGGGHGGTDKESRNLYTINTIHFLNYLKDFV